MVDRMKNALESTKVLRAYDRVFSSPEGKMVLEDICKMGGLGRSSFCPLNPQKTFVNEGARNLTLAILRKTKIQPQIQVTTMLENQN